jgi:WD40 repeat protein
MCSGSVDGSIRVWGGASLEHERTLRDEKRAAKDGVHSLAAWEGRLISGHDGGVMRVWNVSTGVCEQVLEGHTSTVVCLAVSGTGLVSGSYDRSVKVWAMGAGASWACERTLVGHAYGVSSLATWQGKVLSGSAEGSVRVWDIGTGAHDATLTVLEGPVCGVVASLAVHGDRLLSASRDGTIREWALGTWAALRTVVAYELKGPQYPHCLAVSGSKLISGSVCYCFPYGRADKGYADVEKRCEVRVWDLGTLECEHTLPQPVPQAAWADVWCLAAGCGAVWGGVGSEVVVWGRA